MWRTIFFIILVLSASAAQNNKKSILDMNKNPKVENLHKAVALIVQKNFIPQRTRLLRFFTSFNKNLAQKFYSANDIIDSVLSDILDHPYKILCNEQKQYSNLKSNEVVLLDNVDTFRHFFSIIKYIGSLNLSRIVLFISTLSSLDDDSIYLIFEELYYMEILNVALLLTLANGDILLLTYFPFTSEVCRDFKPVIINRFLADEECWEGDNYFPNKLQDFFGCPIVCCTWEQMPYFRVISNGENNTYEGLEAEVLKYISSSINASLKIKLIDPINEETENLETFLSKLLSQQCDLALGSFAYRRDFDTTRFSQTRFYLFSPIFIVTNVINFYTTYDKLAYPFDWDLWLALGLTFGLSSLLISICEWKRQWTGYRNFLFGSTNRALHFNLYTVAVGTNMTTNQLPKRNFARFLLTYWLLLTLILRTAYQSGMYQMLRENKQWNPPQTIENVFWQKYLISTTPKNQKYLEVLPDTQQVRIFNTTIFEAFAEMVEAKEPIALIVPYEYYGYLYKTNLSLWRNLHLVKERLLTKQLTIYSPHHSFLIPLLNKKLSYGLFHGLLSSWQSINILPVEAALKYEHFEQPVNNKNTNSQNILLTLHELGAIFMILIWLHTLAVAVFLIELIWHRCGNILKDWLLKTNIIKDHILQ